MGVSGQHHAPAALYPRGKDPQEKSSAPVGDWTPVVQPLVRHYTAWATAALPFLIIY
jgi:hypothetical protein